MLSNSLPPGSVRVKDTETDDPYEASAADVSRLKATTGWRPGVSLEEGISEVVAYEVRSREYGGV